MLRPTPVCNCDPAPPCTCKVLKKERNNVNDEQVLRFLKRLNYGFESVRSKVLMIVLLLDIKTVFNLAINHER